MGNRIKTLLFSQINQDTIENNVTTIDQQNEFKLSKGQINEINSFFKSCMQLKKYEYEKLMLLLNKIYTVNNDFISDDSTDPKALGAFLINSRDYAYKIFEEYKRLGLNLTVPVNICSKASNILSHNININKIFKLNKYITKVQNINKKFELIIRKNINFKEELLDNIGYTHSNIKLKFK